MNRTGANIRLNLIASTLLGPLRAVVPALLAVFFYPILLHAGGLELVGMWAILQLIVSYIGLCACGLPSLVMRKIAAGGDGAVATIDPIRVALGGYLFGGVVLLVVAAACAQPFWRLVQLPPDPDVVAALVTTILAGVIANVATLYGAVLSGLHRYYVAQMAETLGAVAQFAVAATFIFLGQASLGLAIGLLAGKITILVLVMASTWRREPEYRAIRPRLHLGDFVRLLREAKGFILFNTGSALLEPTARGLLVFMAGPSELALFDIANRLPSLIRNSFTFGLMALFPAITALRAQQRTAGIEQVLRASMGVVVFLIITPLAAYIILAKPVLFLWLGDVGTRVAVITLVTTAWWIVTAYNLPFYLTIQALDLESVVARNVWLHILLIVLGGILLHRVGINAMTISWLVLVTGAISQVQFYVEVQCRTRLLSIAFASRRDIIVALASLVLVASAVWLRVDTTSFVIGSAQILGAAAICFSIWLVILGVFTNGRPVRFLLWTLRGSPAASDGA
jgi:O-antigen/teichoic acid export membrane protein